MDSSDRSTANPKATRCKPNGEYDGCVRTGSGLRCLNNEHCFECWIDAAEKPSSQAYEGRRKVDSVEAQDFVQDGILMLADLIAQRRTAQTTFKNSPITGRGSNDPFISETFEMRPFCGCDQRGNCGHYNFKMGDFTVWWYRHAGRGFRQSRKLKGKEWAQMMIACLKRLGA